jgi:hypothetical protein
MRDRAPANLASGAHEHDTRRESHEKAALDILEMVAMDLQVRSRRLVCRVSR